MTARAGRAGVTIGVIAKEPVPGRVKTRLCPPCTPLEAAAIAEAALADTLTAVSRVEAGRRVVVLDGRPGPWLPAGIEVVPQRGDGLDERLAGAFVDVAGPMVLIGMDTPQVDAPLLQGLVDALATGDVPALLGPSTDGGYWAVGLRRPTPEAFIGVPMSVPETCDEQRRRLRAAAMEPVEVTELVDVDHFDDALHVADARPDGRFAAAVARVASRLAD